MPSTTYELAQRYREQVEAEFKKTASQTTDKTKQGRKKRLQHLSKLYRKVQGRSDLTIQTEGCI